MRELSKNDWRVLAQLLEIARGHFLRHGGSDFNLHDTPENKNLCRCVLDFRGLNSEPIPLAYGEVWTRDDWLADFFASAAWENAE